MDESRFTPDRCEAMARELRQIAQRLVCPENVAGIMLRARQLEAKAAQLRKSEAGGQAERRQLPLSF
jgi:hypothetical protein